MPTIIVDKAKGLYQKAATSANKAGTLSGHKVQVKDNSFRFYEADSGLLIMTEETTLAMGNEVKTITKFSDYKEVDGVKFAFKREIITGPQTIVIEADQVIVNEEIPDEFFN